MKEIKEKVNKMKNRLDVIGKRTEAERDRINAQDKEVKALCKISDIEIAGCINQILSGLEERISKYNHLSLAVSEKLIEKLCISSRELLEHVYRHGFRSEHWTDSVDSDHMVAYLKRRLGYKLLKVFVLFPFQKVLETALYRIVMNTLEYEIMISNGRKK